MNQTSCPQQDEIAAYLLGSVDDKDMERVDNHLAACPKCQAIADKLESSVSDPLIDILHTAEPDDDFSSEPECRQALDNAKRIGGVQSSSAETPGRDNTGSELSPGQHLGEYVILERLGGHMGDVYKAKQTAMDRVVAVKLLPVDSLPEQQAVARFQQEMRAVGKLEHPNIVRAYDAREIDGKHVLVMELVEGKDLSRLIHLHGSLPEADVCEIIRQAAIGLQYVHEQGLVHRDVKPSNLMLTPRGDVKILDLGLARFHAARPTAGEGTAAGQIVGTPLYMAPEQVTRSNAVDIRADVYGLGSTLYALLAGHAPFDSSKHKGTADILAAQVCEAIPPIQENCPKITAALVAVLDRMLAKSPCDRYDTPGQVATALEPFTADCDLRALYEGHESRRLSGRRRLDQKRTAPRSSSWFWKFVAAAAIVALLAVGGKWGYEHSGDLLEKGSRLIAQVTGQEEQKPDVPPAGDAQVKPEPPRTTPPASTPETGVTPGSAGQTVAPKPAPKPADSRPKPPADSGGATAEPSKPTADWLGGAHNRRAAFVVRVDVDHADRIYHGPPLGQESRGELVNVKVTASKSGYLYLIYRSADGRLSCLYPNAVVPDNKIAAGREILVPHPDADFQLRVGPPYGKELLKAVVTLTPRKPEDFGVESFSEGDVTPLQPAPLKHVFVELKKKPKDWAEHQVEIITRPGKPIVGPNRPSEENGNKNSSSPLLPAADSVGGK